jgi:hypothetical protein
MYKNGTLYRANAFGDIYEEDEYTTDSLGNIFKNGTLWRTKESANGEAPPKTAPIFDPTKVKPIIYKSPVVRPKKPVVTTPTTPTTPKTIPTSILPAYLAATAPLSTAQTTTPQTVPVVQESPYFDMRKKFDPGGYNMSTKNALPGVFGDYNPMVMYGSTPITNTGTNQPKVVTMATGGYLDEEPVDIKEILNILERG